MKQRLSQTALILAACALLAAIWLPGAWWQWLCTALVLILVAAGLQPATPDKPTTETLYRGENNDR